MKLTFSALTYRVAAFLRWWTGELSGSAEDLIAWVAPTWRRPATVFVEPTRWLFTEAGSATPMLEIKRSAAEVSPEKFPEPRPAALETGRRVRLVLSVSQAFVRRIRLPVAAAPHLASTLTLQMPKLLPLHAQHLLTDYSLARVDPQAEFIEVDLAALKRTHVDSLIACLHSWGFEVTALQTADAIDSPPNFRFTEIGSATKPMALRPLDRWLLATAAVLGVSCLALAGTQEYRAQRSLGEEQATMRASAATALARRETLLRRLEPLKALEQIEHAPSAAMLLAEVTRLIPPESWVTTLEFKQRSLRLVGLSPDAAGLVRYLAGSAQLSDVELRSSVSVGVGTGKDRFEITAQVGNPSP